MDERIGFIGLGIMGAPMALNLMKAGFEVIVYNRTPNKVERLVAVGAKGAKSVEEVAINCPVVITMVSDTPDVEDIILGQSGIKDSIQPGSVVIVSPSPPAHP